VAVLEDSGALQSCCLPSCCQWQEVVALAQQAGRCALVPPMADLEDHQVRPADTPEGGHPAAEVRQPG
jgi:hypothetical protein